MQNSEPQGTHDEGENILRILDSVSARYDLQIQLCQEQLKRLKQKQWDKLQSAAETSTTDFVIQPRRAA